MTAATNGSADSTINFSEGQAPSSLNDSARAVMARLKEYTNDQAGSLTTGGSSTAYTVTSNEVFASLAEMSGNKLTVRFNATNGASPTLNVDGLGAKAIQVASGTAVGTGVILANSVHELTYDNSIPAWLVHGVPAQVQDSTVATASIVAKAVTYAKIQDISATSRLLGRATAGAGVTEELTIGTGLLLSGTTLTAPAFPPAAAFKNFALKVASNTTYTVTADYVTTTDGSGNFQTTAVNSTVNLGTTGADALDAGTIAIDTWYYNWVVAKADGTTKCIASTSSTAPTMPSGYTYKARIGAVQTIHGSATLYGTWQLGRDAQYVVGLAQTTVVPKMSSANTGSVLTAVDMSRFIPPTASKVNFSLNSTGGNTLVYAAPNSGYGAPSSTTNPAPVSVGVGTGNINSVCGTFLVESTNIYWSSANTGCGIWCNGWVDNI